MFHALYKTAQAFSFPVSKKHKIAQRGRYTERRETYIALNKFTGSRSTNLCACRSDGLGFQEFSRGIEPLENLLFATQTQLKGINLRNGLVPLTIIKTAHRAVLRNLLSATNVHKPKWGVRGNVFSPINYNLYSLTSFLAYTSII